MALGFRCVLENKHGGMHFVRYYVGYDPAKDETTFYEMHWFCEEWWPQ